METQEFPFVPSPKKISLIMIPRKSLFQPQHLDIFVTGGPPLLLRATFQYVFMYTQFKKHLQ